MRTYYSFQVPKSADKTYNLELMGLWGWAELAIGIIVSCLPALPKFVQHIGSDLSKAFSLGSKPEPNPAHDLEATGKTLKADIFAKIQRSSLKYDGSSSSPESLDDPLGPQVRLHGDYHTPFTFDSSGPCSIMAHEPAQLPSVIIATRRNDLEYGQSKF